MKAGYAYHYTGERADWKTSPDDDWDTEMVDAGTSSFVGLRRIDGSQCTVWEHEGELWAQTAVMNPAPKGGASSSEKRERYARNDPKGWGGDPSRGAALGRSTEVGDTGFAGKLTLERIKLDRGGYDRQGTYFGQGEPLFFLSDEDATIDRTFRAHDRRAAVAKAREWYPRAKVR